MCGETFWKRVVVFCLAFGLGVFVSSAFISKEIPAESLKTTSSSMPENLIAPANAGSSEKNCVAVDSSLRYERLISKAPDRLSSMEVAPPPKSPNPQTAKKFSKNDQEKQKDSAELKRQFYVPSEDSAEYQTLLHRERCFEAQRPK